MSLGICVNVSCESMHVSNMHLCKCANVCACVQYICVILCKCVACVCVCVYKCMF